MVVLNQCRFSESKGADVGLVEVVTLIHASNAGLSEISICSWKGKNPEHSTITV